MYSSKSVSRSQVKKIIIGFCLGIIFTSCGPKHHLTVRIKGFGNDTICIQTIPVSDLYQNERISYDTLVSMNDGFAFDSRYDEPVLMALYPKKARIKLLNGTKYLPESKLLYALWHPGENISIEGRSYDDHIAYEASGSEFSLAFSQNRKGYVTELSESFRLRLKLDTMLSKGGDQEGMNPLAREWSNISVSIQSRQLEYFKNNKDKDLSAFFLLSQRPDTLALYHNDLLSDVREGTFKEAIDFMLIKRERDNQILEAEKNTAPGKKAPGFSLRSPEGTELALLDIPIKKYLVLDFWGSWCHFCEKGIPKMKAYYTRYKPEIEILGIACKDKTEEWKSSIEQHELDWLHVINDDDSERDITTLYGIRGYPTKIILDKEKNVIARFIGESEDFYEKLEELMND